MRRLCGWCAENTTHRDCHHEVVVRWERRERRSRELFGGTVYELWAVAADGDGEWLIDTAS